MMILREPDFLREIVRAASWDWLKEHCERDESKSCVRYSRAPTTTINLCQRVWHYFTLTGMAQMMVLMTPMALHLVSMMVLGLLRVGQSY